MANDDKYRPYQEIEFDFRSGLTIDSAVLVLLGHTYEIFREVTFEELEWRYEMERAGEYPDEKLIDSDLSMVLYELKEAADSDYREARSEGEPENVLAEKRQKIEAVHRTIETAYWYYCEIVDELAKGPGSALRIAPLLTKDPQKPYITIKSLHDWAIEKKFRPILTIRPPESNEFEQTKDMITQSSLLSGLDAESSTQLYITLASLAEALADMDTTYRNDDRLNVINIASDLENFIKTNTKENQMSEVKGQSKSTLKNAITEGGLRFKQGKRFDNRLNYAKARNLFVTLGFLYDFFLEKHPEPKPSLDDVAKQLAERNQGKHQQSSEHIARYLTKAKYIQENPDRRDRE